MFYQPNFAQPDANQPAIAILATEMPMRGDIIAFNKDLDGDGVNEVVSTCDTSEKWSFCYGLAQSVQ